MKIAVTGGRTFSDQRCFDAAMDALQPNTLLFCDAHGADEMAKAFANKHGIPYREFARSWSLMGVLAGLICNIRMLEQGKPDMVAAFPGSAGTEHCIKNALLRGIPVRRFK